MSKLSRNLCVRATPVHPLWPFVRSKLVASAWVCRCPSPRYRDWLKMIESDAESAIARRVPWFQFHADRWTSGSIGFANCLE